jgi:hypothetical protein
MRPQLMIAPALAALPIGDAVALDAGGVFAALAVPLDLGLDRHPLHSLCKKSQNHKFGS